MGRAQGVENQVVLNSRRRKKIAVDFDGTAWDFLAALCLQPECTDEHRAVLRSDVCDHWDHPVNLLGLDVMERARSYEMLQRVGLLPGFAEAMQVLQEHGYEPVILTHNSAEVIETIRRYLQSHGFHFEVQRARPADKIAWCLEHDTMLVDDAPETIALAAEAGVKIVSLRYLYNADAIDSTGSPHASDWPSLLPKIHEQLAV